MMTYIAICPVCGKINCGLDLEETKGWMECEDCHTVTRDLSFREKVKIPVYKTDQMEQVLAYLGIQKTGREG